MAGLRPISQSLAIRPAASVRRGVTAVRTDGVGLPTIDWFGEPGDLHVAGTSDRRERIAHDLLPTPALVREAVDTALDSLEALELQARDVARRFRRLAVDEAHLGLSQLVHGTQTLLQLAAMTAIATGVDLDTVCEAHGLTAEAETHSALASLIGRQLEHDWHGLARVIDHSFVRVLDAWRMVFHILGGTAGPHGHAA